MFEIRNIIKALLDNKREIDILSGYGVYHGSFEQTHVIGDEDAWFSVHGAEMFETSEMDFTAAVFDEFKIPVGLFDLGVFIKFSLFSEFSAGAEDGKIYPVKIPAFEEFEPDGDRVVFWSIVSVYVLEQVSVEHRFPE